MTLPPPPNTPYGGPHGEGFGGGPQWGSQQQPAPAGGQFGGPPSWGPPPGQPQWGGPPSGPPPKGGKGKWILGGIIVALVVALAVTITVLVVRPDSDGPSAANGGDSEFASAGDTGPVNIITEDPTCETWGRISRKYADTVNGIDWANHDEVTPATDWSPELREKYKIASSAMAEAADGIQKIVKLTPHRVTRELYEQFIAYTNSFEAALPSYEEEDDSLAVAITNLSGALSMICSAVTYGVAETYAPLVPSQPVPDATAEPQEDIRNPTRFIESVNRSCARWDAMTREFATAVSPWRAIDPQIPASQWSPEQRSAAEAALPAMVALADEVQELGAQSENATFEDFAFLSAQYWRAFVLALPDYEPADNYLSAAGTYLANVNLLGCESAK